MLKDIRKGNPNADITLLIATGFHRLTTKEELISKFGSLNNVYNSIVKFLFVGENFSKSIHKQMFWRVFGDIVLNYSSIDLHKN